MYLFIHALSSCLNLGALHLIYFLVVSIHCDSPRAHIYSPFTSASSTRSIDVHPIFHILAPKKKKKVMPKPHHTSPHSLSTIIDYIKFLNKFLKLNKH